MRMGSSVLFEVDMRRGDALFELALVGFESLLDSPALLLPLRLVWPFDFADFDLDFAKVPLLESG
tara:strand:+ start:347 stop:541 length:195 start_codon:yes stop_codon:yes gene_type:complete